MRELTLEAGVPESTYDSILAVDADITIEELTDRLTFLKQVDSKEFHEFHYTYHLLAPEVWARYKLLGLYKTPEQVRLKEAKTALRHSWKKAYGPKARKLNEVTYEEASIVEDAGQRNPE